MRGMSEEEGKKGEGLIRDKYELILRELQTVITVFYLLLVSIGMLFISSKYSAFNINIFEYADVFDFLIAPFHDVKIIYISLIMTLVPGAMIYLDRIWKAKRPEWYSKWNFGWDKKPWFNVFRVISFGGLLLIFLFEGANGYGQFKKRTISLSPIIEVFYADGTTIVGNEIGKTKEVIFLMVGEKVRIIPLASLVKGSQAPKTRIHE